MTQQVFTGLPPAVAWELAAAVFALLYGECCPVGLHPQSWSPSAIVHGYCVQGVGS